MKKTSSTETKNSKVSTEDPAIYVISRAAGTNAETGVEQRAIHAAIRLFSSKGIYPTSMDDVAKEAGMARSTLYRYFKDKDQLIVQVMEQEVLLLALQLSGKIKAERFGDFIVEGVLLAVEHIPKHPVLGKMFAADTLETAHRVMFMANRLSSAAIDVINPAIAAAKQKGELRENISAEMLMDWLLRVVFSLVTTQSDFTKNKKQIRKLLENMLLPVLVKE